MLIFLFQLLFITSTWSECEKLCSLDLTTSIKRKGLTAKSKKNTRETDFCMGFVLTCMSQNIIEGKQNKS